MAHSTKRFIDARTDTCLILGLQCLKNWRNFGIMTLRGRLRASLSRSSAESSQIFCKAPNAPYRILQYLVTNIWSWKTGKDHLKFIWMPTAWLCSSNCFSNMSGIHSVPKRRDKLPIWRNVLSSYPEPDFLRNNLVMCHSSG